MKIFYTISLTLLYTLSFAQWPNALDKRLVIEQSSEYNQIAGTQHDEQGNTYVAIKQGKFVSRTTPYSNNYLPIRFQKLDKKGIELWNLDSAVVICNMYISVPEKTGGLYVFYTKLHNTTSNGPVNNNMLACTYIDKEGIKKWNTELENFDAVGSAISATSIKVNAVGEVELYFVAKEVVCFQKLDRDGKKLLTENKKLSDNIIGFGDEIAASKNGFVYSKRKATTIFETPVKFLYKRDKDWNDVWKKEVAIEIGSINSIFFDNDDNTFVLGDIYGTTLKISKINANGDIITSTRPLNSSSYVVSHYYYFDAEKNLNLYLLLNNVPTPKITYIKINMQGDIIIDRELEDINSRIIESNSTVPYNLYKEKLYDFSLNNRGGILLSWMKKTGDFTELYLSRFDPEGNLLWDKDKLIDTDSTIISTTNIPPTDSTYAVLYLTGKFQYPDRYPPMHSSNFYIKKLSRNGNYNELNAKIGDKVCENGKLELNLDVEGTYENNNQFKVLLSDADGSFANAKEIGASSQTEFSIDNLKEKEGDYQVKVVSTNPAVEVAKPMALKIQKAPSFTLQYNETVKKFDSTAIRFYITGTPPYTMKLWDDTEAQISTNFYERYIKPTATSEYTIKSFSDANCAAEPVSFKITVLEPLSTEWQFSTDNLKIYPIPATTNLNIELNNEVIKNASITIYSLKGESLYQKDNIEASIDLRGLQQGVYIVKGSINGKVFSRKILIEK